MLRVEQARVLNRNSILTRIDIPSKQNMFCFSKELEIGMCNRLFNDDKDLYNYIESEYDKLRKSN